MTANETGTPILTEEEKQKNRERIQAVEGLYNHLRSVLTKSFENHKVEGMIGQHPMYGPLFVFNLSRAGKTFGTGFFVNEVARIFQTNANPEQWVCSFYVDMIRADQHHPLPESPKTEEEGKAIIDNNIVPQCIEAIQSEFPDQEMRIGLGMNDDLGPVIEASFVSITDGANTTGLPLPYVYALYLLNRDPSEPIIEALTQILEKHGSKKTEE